MAGKLKPLDVERETRPGKYPDGDGLYLVVASPTSKNWSYRYWKDGKQRWLGQPCRDQSSWLPANAVRPSSSTPGRLERDCRMKHSGMPSSSSAKRP
jgi:Arm domain-containing DNA-binding protein